MPLTYILSKIKTDNSEIHRNFKFQNNYQMFKIIRNFVNSNTLKLLRQT